MKSMASSVLKHFNKVSPIELLVFPATFFMLLAYGLGGPQFAKLGTPISLPRFLGEVQDLNVRFFPMEMFMLLMGIALLASWRRIDWPQEKFSLWAILISLLFWGCYRISADIQQNPLLVMRNSAFVWYLFLPLIVALLPISKDRWELLFRTLWIVVSALAPLFLFYAFLAADHSRVFGFIDVGLAGLLAYGLCGRRSKLAKVFLIEIGCIYGFAYFGKFQRTILVGMGITIILLALLHFFRPSGIEKPEWKRLRWIFAGLLLGLFLGLAAFSFPGKDSSVAEFYSSPFVKSELNHRGLEKFRYYLWMDALSVIKTSPIIGIGFTEQVVKRVYAGAGKFIPNGGSFERENAPAISGPHNSYLNAIARLGVIGNLFLMLHSMALHSLFKGKLFACFFVLLGQMVYAAFNVGLEGPVRSFALLILLGVALKGASSDSLKEIQAGPYHKAH